MDDDGQPVVRGPWKSIADMSEIEFLELIQARLHAQYRILELADLHLDIVLAQSPGSLRHRE